MDTRLRMLLKTVTQESATLRLLALDPAAVARRFGLSEEELAGLRAADLLRASELVASRSRGTPDPRQLARSPLIAGAQSVLTPSPPPPPPGALVVNMTPASQSDEATQDSEPWLAVNPANTQQMVGTAFTPHPAGTPGNNAPVYISNDGGQTWALNSIVPSNQITADITVSFSTSTNRLYAGILPQPPVQVVLPDGTVINHWHVRVLRSTNPFGAATMDQLFDDIGTNGYDQPRIVATTVAGKDRLFVGVNDFNVAPKTAIVLVCSDAGAAVTPFTTVQVESRTRPGQSQDAPSIQPALAADGNTVYAAFFGWHAADATGLRTVDVVVVRDDNGGVGANAFQALKDKGDSLPGVRAVTGITIKFPDMLGQERVGSDIAIAVDPSHKETVYLAYCALFAGTYNIHVVRSTDSGATWSKDLKTLTSAFGPSLAINSAGVVGLLSQQLTGPAGSQRWTTRLSRSSDGGSTWSDRVLASPPADTPAVAFPPYLGDYQRLQAIGRDFYGVFCANNTPDLNSFPSGVRYQRNANFSTHTLLGHDGTTPVNASIDPFFFKVTG